MRPGALEHSVDTLTFAPEGQYQTLELPKCQITHLCCPWVWGSHCRNFAETVTDESMSLQPAQNEREVKVPWAWCFLNCHRTSGLKSGVLGVGETATEGWWGLKTLLYEDQWTH